MSLKIEKGIPIPPSARYRSGKGIMDQIKAMKVGDSFVWKGKSISNAYLYARMAGVRLCSRTINGEKRFWRVE